MRAVTRLVASAYNLGLPLKGKSREVVTELRQTMLLDCALDYATAAIRGQTYRQIMAEVTTIIGKKGPK